MLFPLKWCALSYPRRPPYVVQIFAQTSKLVAAIKRLIGPGLLRLHEWPDIALIVGGSRTENPVILFRKQAFPLILSKIEISNLVICDIFETFFGCPLPYPLSCPHRLLNSSSTVYTKPAKRKNQNLRSTVLSKFYRDTK